MLRQSDLCPSPQYCPEVLTEEPNAGPSALPCEGCPQQALLSYLASPAGRLIQVVIDLDFALQAQMALPLAEIPYPEFLLLRQLMEERSAHQAEEIRKNSKRQR